MQEFQERSDRVRPWGPGLRPIRPSNHCKRLQQETREAAPTFRPADACGTSAERFHIGAIACVHSPERAGHKHGGW